MHAFVCACVCACMRTCVHVRVHVMGRGWGADPGAGHADGGSSGLAMQSHCQPPCDSRNPAQSAAGPRVPGSVSSHAAPPLSPADCASSTHLQRSAHDEEAETQLASVVLSPPPPNPRQSCSGALPTHHRYICHFTRGDRTPSQSPADSATRCFSASPPCMRTVHSVLPITRHLSHNKLPRLSRRLLLS